MPTMSSAWPVNVVPSTAATPIVFSSTCGSTSSGPIVYLSSAAAARSAARRRSSGRTSPRRRARRRRRRGSGLSVGLPAASRRSRHFHFSDSAPSMIASDEPWVRAPVVSPGALKRSASMRMQRCSISAVLRVLGVVDEVAVQVLGDDPLRLGLHPGRHEGGQVALRDPVEDEVLLDQPLRDRAARRRLRGSCCRARPRAATCGRSSRYAASCGWLRSSKALLILEFGAPGHGCRRRSDPHPMAALRRRVLLYLATRYCAADIPNRRNDEDRTSRRGGRNHDAANREPVQPRPPR